MGLTHQSTGNAVVDSELHITRSLPDDKIIALAGNPNVGKSTVFNELTGMNQHTGNWPGKTVTNAQGKYIHNDKNFILVDIPGTYSLMANSVEEEVARDFICFGGADATVVVTDATCLERGLELALQVMALTRRVVVCVNLMDEARRRGIKVDISALEAALGVPVAGCAARNGAGLEKLLQRARDVAEGRERPAPREIRLAPDVEYACERIAAALRELGVWFTGGVCSPYIWMACPEGMGSWEFFDLLLREAGVAGVPGAGFGRNGEGYFRLTGFGSREETCQAIVALQELYRARGLAG